MTTVRPDSHADFSVSHTPPATLPSIWLDGGRRVRHPSTPQEGHALTIVTVVYNGCDLLAESVASVLAQQRSDVAYLVIDGDSEDRTVDLLESFGDDIEYWISERDRGIYHAMNKAVQLAEPGSYILFLGAGDKILRLPDPATIAAARASDIQVLFGDVQIGDWLFRSSFSAKLQYRNTLHHQGLFIRKGRTQEPWFDESFKVFSDWDLNLKLFQTGVSAQRLDYTIAYAEPDGVSAKLHLSEIAKIIGRRCGSLRALVAIAYHGGLHQVRRHARILRSLRK